MLTNARDKNLINQWSNLINQWIIYLICSQMLTRVYFTTFGLTKSYNPNALRSCNTTFKNHTRASSLYSSVLIKHMSCAVSAGRLASTASLLLLVTCTCKIRRQTKEKKLGIQTPSQGAAGCIIMSKGPACCCPGSCE